ncbi:hypothetical protein [Nitrosopumilus sp. S6]
MKNKYVIVIIIVFGISILIINSLYVQQTRFIDFVESGGDLTETECLAIDGKWEIRAYVRNSQPHCNLPTSDEGKRCTDSTQCESFCQAEDDVQYGTQSIGICYGYQFATCANQVINGTASGMICVD